MEIRTAIRKLRREAEALQFATRNDARLAHMYAIATATIADLDNGETDEAVRHARILVELVKAEEQYRKIGTYRDPWPCAYTWRAEAAQINRYIEALEQ
jgi:hypothetical protein